MHNQQLNRISAIGLIVLSLTALLMVLTAALPLLLSGHRPPPATDEGARARVFQLLIMSLVPLTFMFLASADWRQPLQSVRPLAIAAAAVVLAFGVLYYLEH